MHSINHHNELSNFSNYLKKDATNSVGFNDLNLEGQNSQSIGFSYFSQNQIESQFDKVEPQQIKPEDSNDQRDQTVSNQFQGILDNSINFSIQFKNFKIKKPATYHFSQGYLNNLQEQNDIEKFDSSSKQKSIKIPYSKNNNSKQISRKGAQHTQNNPGTYQNLNTIKFQNFLNTEQNNQDFEQKPSPTSEIGFQAEENFKNLKSVAKAAFDVIKAEKTASYQWIATKMFQSVTKEGISAQQGNSCKLQQISVSSTGKSSKKSELIENMIKNKSFSQIKEMAEIQKQPFSRKMDCHIQNQDHQQFSQQKNIKNIRRRLYDAINVMLAANAIQKRQSGEYAVKSVSSLKQKKINKDEQLTQSQLQSRIEQKKQQLIAKKRYKDLLVAKYIRLEKHLLQNQKSGKIDPAEKIVFPLAFFKAALPSSITIGSEGQFVEIKSPQKIDIQSDIDMLQLLYWVEKEQILKKAEQITRARSIELSESANQDQKCKKKLKPNEDSMLYQTKSLKAETKLEHE